MTFFAIVDTIFDASMLLGISLLAMITLKRCSWAVAAGLLRMLLASI